MKRIYPILKRFLDIFVSFSGIMILSPLMATIALLIKLDSPGRICYRGLRVGRDGRLFYILKFRTMVENADKIGGSSVPVDDPRVTRVGRFLRKYKLDELPQLFNVLKGEMSLVGPRPQVEWAVRTYSSEEHRLLTVLPGITDYASVYFADEGKILRESTDPDKDYMEKIHPKKMELGLKYVNERSLWTDLKIIVLTIVAVFHGADGTSNSSMLPHDKTSV